MEELSSQIENQNSGLTTSQKKLYIPPVLERLGDVRTVVLGNSPGLTEPGGQVSHHNPINPYP